MKRYHYTTLKNTWQDTKTKEKYESKITMTLPEWQEFVASGGNSMLAGGVIPGGTVQTPGGNSGAVFKGHVRQGY